MEAFNDIFEDCTSLGTKIPKDNYLSEGKYIVVDQGQNIIAGYTNEEDGLYEDVPAIVFGDHTRIIKYVDEPFFLGADGVKLLKSKKKDANYKYLYYALKNARIPDTGYNRHFKWLKEVNIEYPEPDKQQKIVEVLDKISRVIEERKLELQQLDDLIKARFVEVFGNPVTNDKGWSTDSCKNLMKKIGSGATPKGGRKSYCDEGISLIRSMNVYNNRFEYKDLAHITDEQAEQLDNVTIEKSDVLLNITGASVARCCVVPDDLLPARVNQHVSVIRCKESLLPEFVCSMFTEDNYQRLLWNIATAGGATREAITKQQIEELQLIVPPLDLQKQFADFVKQVDKSKVVVKKALDEAQLLFDSLMQEYFG